jgi:hypothetical protein
MKYGRVFPKNALGLFSISREIRHTLARDSYIDIDIENCHPVLLYHLCTHNNIQCDNLKYYIDNRTQLLNEVMRGYGVIKDQAKQLFIQLLYFGSFDSWCKNHNISNKEPLNFITEFKKELNLIGEVVVAKNPKLSKEIEKKKDEQHIKNYNIKSSVCSLFLQEYESRILETIFLYCQEKKIIQKSVVLCADGLMIPKENYCDDLLNEFKNVVVEKMGFDLNFTKKEMDQGYTIEQIKEAQITDDENPNGVYNDLEAARKVYKLYPHFVCCHSVLYVFDDEAGIWSDKEEIIFKIISRFTDHLYLLTINNKGEVKVNKRGYGDSTVLKRQMIAELKPLCINDNWIITLRT